MAAVLAVNRLCAPGSELAIEQRWYPSTAPADLLEIEEGKIDDTRLFLVLNATCVSAAYDREQVRPGRDTDKESGHIAFGFRARSLPLLGSGLK